jgi:purine-binding chemotaxis protein CheW
MSDGAPHRNARSILRARAEELARTPPLAPAEAPLQLLEFMLAKERYAVETRHVLEVYPLRNITPIPSTQAFLAGVVNVRGRIVAVVDLKKFFDLPETGLTDLHRIVIVSGPDLELGLLADVSVGVLSVSPNALQPALPAMTAIGNEFLKGVTVDRLIVLDIDRLLSDPRIIVNEEMEI